MKTYKNDLNYPTQLLGWLIIVVIALGGMGLVLEFAARIMLPNINILLTIITPVEDDRNYVLKPNASTVYRGLYEKSAHETEWRINPQGLRTDSLIEDKADGVFRIVTYGDSETFGWSVPLENTWQRQMEKYDSSIQVVNMGIPGYNIESIATHVEKTLANLQADMVIYLFNKNDVYKSLNYHPQLSKSYLYLIVNMGLYQLKATQRKQWRNSEQGAKYFQKHLHRIIATSKQQSVPLLLAIQHWKYAKVLPSQHQVDQYIDSVFSSDSMDNAVLTINVEDVVRDFPRRDAHLTEPAHRALAEYFCRLLSNGVENRCRP